MKSGDDVDGFLNRTAVPGDRMDMSSGSGRAQNVEAVKKKGNRMGGSMTKLQNLRKPGKSEDDGKLRRAAMK